MGNRPKEFASFFFAIPLRSFKCSLPYFFPSKNKPTGLVACECPVANASNGWNLLCSVEASWCNPLLGPTWWFQTFFIFTPIWGRFPFWLIFFRWVETTNQIIFFSPFTSGGHLHPPKINQLGFFSEVFGTFFQRIFSSSNHSFLRGYAKFRKEFTNSLNTNSNNLPPEHRNLHRKFRLPIINFQGRAGSLRECIP